MTRHIRRITSAAGLALLVTTPLAAVALPPGTLWRVEQTCMLNQKTTGSPFPCLKVDEAEGYAVLRAPFRQTHIVTMPTQRITGVEDPALRQPSTRNYFADAWNARSFVEAEVEHPVTADDMGLAVNSELTRSQNQLHIHVDCLRARVKQQLAPLVATMPTDHWQEHGFTLWGQPYWTRLVAQPTLAGVNPFVLADEIPPLRARPGLMVLAAVGVKLADGSPGFVLLAGQSNPHRGAEQSTSEDLLDHKCRAV